MKWSLAACLLIALGVCAAYAAGAEQQALPAEANKSQKAVSESTMRAGHAVYMDNCAACHTESGVGISQLFLALKGSAVVLSDDPTVSIRFVLQGTKNPATGHVPTGPAMPAMGWKLSDQEVAAVISYIRNSWGNAAPAVSPSDVHSVRQQNCTGLQARMHLQSYFDYFCRNPKPTSATSGADQSK